MDIEPKPKAGLAERKGEATEKETLEDLEDSFGSSEDENEGDDLTSPDGALDEEDELEKADPM
jgi:hypothetical protein